jgi:ketosteroid isomerase-like protein
MVEVPSPSNLEILFSEWLDAMRRGDLARMAAVLAPDAVHQGIRSESRCESAEQILESVRPRVGNPPPLDALELVAAGDHVVMSVRGPAIGAPAGRDDDERRDQASIVFTLRDGKITRMHDFVHRRDALASAGASPAWE